jgi:hypothetical protein
MRCGGGAEWSAVYVLVDARRRGTGSQYSKADCREVDPPIQVETASWVHSWAARLVAGRANAAPTNVESHTGESITGDLMTKAW